MRLDVNRRAGDYAFHSNHIINGATGSHGTNHSSVQVVHATGSHDDPDPDTGVMDPSPRAQNGWDAVVTKISDAGVFEGIFAVDTMPVDGKYDDTSLNSGWGGYSYFTNLDDFAASGDNDNLVAMGAFRGKLTFPTAAGAAPVTLENRKWKRYDGFLTKFNANTLEVVWATGEKIQRPTCNTNTDGTPDSKCDEPTSMGGRVATTSEGHVVATSNYGDAAGGRTTLARATNVMPLRPSAPRPTLSGPSMASESTRLIPARRRTTRNPPSSPPSTSRLLLRVQPTGPSPSDRGQATPSWPTPPAPTCTLLVAWMRHRQAMIRCTRSAPVA
jgi:hypothetical protein